jgi:hypothetical protein
MKVDVIVDPASPSMFLDKKHVALRSSDQEDGAEILR